jgi:hypothetical protein
MSFCCGSALKSRHSEQERSMPNNQDRALRYRRLALAEPDKAKAALLQKIADEAERGVLCTVDGTPKQLIADTNGSKFSPR